MNKIFILKEQLIERHKKNVVFLFLLFCTCSLMAQTPSIKWEGGFAAKHQLNEKWTLKTAFLGRETFNSYRSETIKPYLDRYEIKAFVGYSLADKHQIGLAYTFRQNNPFQQEPSIENRITLQYSYSAKYFTHRLRFEERIYSKITAVRLRYQLAFEKTIGEKQRTILLLADELLSNFKSGNQTFENRLDVGIGRKFKKGRKFKLLLSNRNEKLFKDSKKHILQLITVYSFTI